MRWRINSSRKAKTLGSALFFYSSNAAASREYSSELLVIEKAERLALAAWQDCLGEQSDDTLTLLTVEHGRIYVEAEHMQGMLVAGQLYLLPRWEHTVRLTAQEESSCLTVALSGELPNGLEQQLEDGLFCPAGLTAARQTIYQLQNKEVSESIVSAAAYQLLMDIRQQAEPYVEAAGYPLVVQAALGIIQEEYATLYGVDEIAERVGVSLEHLVRVFSKTVGTPPGKYLKMQRLQYAQTLLTQPDMTIELVAELCGFAGANYFAKVFRSAFGVSPSEYRKAHTKKPDGFSRRQIDELYL